MSKFIIAFFILLSFSSCYVGKAYKFRKYDLVDLPKFEADFFEPSKTPFQFKRGSISQKNKLELDSMLQGSNKYGFAVIRNDSILYEFYNTNIQDSSLLPSFSVAKSFISTLLGIALEEGKIKSLNEPITNYLPELAQRDLRFSKITIQHVLDMRSGIKSSENYYNPMSDVLKLGFGKNIWKKGLKLDIESESGLKFEYKSVNTQLLGFVIERATGQKLQTYFDTKIYQPLQMSHRGSWIVDDHKHRTIRAFCCMNFALLDYAKFGKLILDKGQFNGKRVISEKWIENSTNADTLSKYDGYKNQWWQWNSKSDPSFYARGLLNQYIHITPSKNMIIVHFGNSQNPNNPLKKGFEKRLTELF
jgi:CubicO group peptidase (beta-lactamase class C family)